MVKRAAKRQDGAPTATESRAPETPSPLVPSPLAAIEAHLMALRSDSQAIQHQLVTIGGTLQTAVLADVFALIAESDVPERSELQRRAQAIQVELTLRRQEVALAEWRRKLEAAIQEGERQRQLFARLEADFTRRSAQSEQVADELERAVADFARRSAEFEAAITLSQQTEAALRSALAEQAATFERELAAQAAASKLVHAEHETALAAQEAALVGQERAFAEREQDLKAAVAARETACDALEAERAAMTGTLDDAVALAQARQQMVITLERDLAGNREENAALREALAALREECAALQTVLDDREIGLTEAERRVEELRSSRWRKLGIGLGVARRATFER
jgi:chromosome segregation ATPase